MKHKIYTIISVKCINRSSKLQKSIVVVCDKLWGRSNLSYISRALMCHQNHLPVLHTKSEVLRWFEKPKLTGLLSHILQLANWLLTCHSTFFMASMTLAHQGGQHWYTISETGHRQDLL